MWVYYQIRAVRKAVIPVLAPFRSVFERVIQAPCIRLSLSDRIGVTPGRSWFVVQGRRYTGEIHDGTEWALLLRLFKRGAWIEAGVTDDGKLQAMAMVNF